MTNSNFCSWENGEILWGQEVCTLIHTQNEERQTNWHVYTEGLPVVLPWIFGNHLGGQYKSVKQRCNIKIRLFCNRKTLPQILPSLTKLETAILYKCCLYSHRSYHGKHYLSEFTMHSFTKRNSFSSA